MELSPVSSGIGFNPWPCRTKQENLELLQEIQRLFELAATLEFSTWFRPWFFKRSEGLDFVQCSTGKPIQAPWVVIEGRLLQLWTWSFLALWDLSWLQYGEHPTLHHALLSHDGLGTRPCWTAKLFLNFFFFNLGKAFRLQGDFLRNLQGNNVGLLRGRETREGGHTISGLLVWAHFQNTL